MLYTGKFYYPPVEFHFNNTVMYEFGLLSEYDVAVAKSF
jgi:hypothetical protein